MEKSFSGSYREAGVDITAGYRAVELMKEHIKRTVTPGVISGIGGFGGLYQLDLEGSKKPVLVSGTDGVGTKLKLAFLLDKHDTVGMDCVAMCVNDIICCGAKPLYFLDYIACGKNVPERIASIVKGIADGCVAAGCALIGGETAEMPGFYPEDEYDLAGFATGIVEKDRIIDGSAVNPGDVIIGVASSGLHSNGFSLVRKALRLDAGSAGEAFGDSTLGEVCLTPTKIYVKPVLGLISQIKVKAISNITGGGFNENVPRMLPEGITAKIYKGSWTVPLIFGLIRSRGGVPERDMYNTFNMGIGMAITVAPEDAEEAVAILAGYGEKAYIIGRAERGGEGIELC